MFLAQSPSRSGQVASATTLCAAAILTLVAVPRALAQTALDGGNNRALDSVHGQRKESNALDNSFRVGSGGRNDAAVNLDFQARNLMVTGDVAGGRGFRGSVGYTAADDFRGALGGDSSREYRNNSMANDPFYLLTSRDSDRYSFAGANGLIEARRDFATPQTAAGAEMLAARGYGSLSPLSSMAAGDSRLKLDRSGNSLSASNQLRDGTSSVVYGFARGAGGGTFKVVAGSLRGVSLVPRDDLVDMLGLGLRESARLRDEFRALGLANRKEFLATFPTPFATKLDTGRIDSSVDRSGAVATGSAAHKRYTREYAQTLESMHARATTSRGSSAAGGASTLPPTSRTTEDWLSSGMSRVRDRLSEQRPLTVPSPTGAEGQSQGATPGGAPEGEAGTDDPTPEEMFLLLNHGGTVSSLEGQGGGHVAELLRFGTEEMKRGRPFEAERFYSLAAGISPRDPMPMAGVANAQIAAGLSLAASYTLTMLFRQSPEMIDMRFEAGLLGSEASLRATAAAAVASANMNRDDAASYGLAVAYIGHQLDDPAMVQVGLSLMSSTTDADGFVDVLRPIWVKVAEPAPEPAPAPAP